MKSKNVMTGSVDVYVPIGESFGIKTGSGMVGQKAQNGQVEIYFEGDLYGAVGMENYAERCYSAAGRMKTRYPTITTRVVKEENVRRIGSLDLRSGKVNLEVPIESVRDWVDLSEKAQLSAPSVRARNENLLGKDIMRHPGKHAGLLAQLPILSEEARAEVIEQAALSMDED